MDKKELLQRVFGYSEFRPGQETLIDGILSGQDVFGIMPTGGGKSMCYQIPALLLPGITFVVSPLISLMRDQVMALKAAGVPAAYINSTLNGPQVQAVYLYCRGRGTLYFPVGTGFSSQLFKNTELYFQSSQPSGGRCVYSDGNQTGAGGCGAYFAASKPDKNSYRI